MKSPTSLLLLAVVASPATAQIPGEPAGDGPRGSSQVASGEERYDAVGYADVGGLAGMSAASAGLAPGSFAEITALDSGRTILVAIVGAAANAGLLIMLSPDAASALGVTAPAGVRVRRVTPTPQDVALLRQGQAASGRSDAPPVLLVPLRKKLVAMPAALGKPPPRKPARVAVAPKPPAPATAKADPTPRPAATGGYVVQIAALADATRARALAEKVGGRVVPGGALFRVQTGPFADRAAALRGQAAAAKLGYPGGQLVRTTR